MWKMKNNEVPANPSNFVTPAKAGVQNALKRLDSSFRDCVVINKSAIKAVIPAKAGIQNLMKILNSESRFFARME